MNPPPQPQHPVLLADNFPAKAYLLVAYLTESDPVVSSFSSDGASFEIYDQSVFASKYLPQYFKHANYGSFVRQLNLYGFTSSRLKQNNDVVVWTHDCFRRDRKELVKEIKRTKKAKAIKGAKPSQVVHIEPRSPSPPSLSLSDELSTDCATKAGGGSKASTKSKRDPGIDQGWLESEFLQLKRQNKFLERKLDAQSELLEQKLEALLQITLRISPSSAGAQPGGPGEGPPPRAGGKRRRTSPAERADVVLPPYAAHAPRRLLSVSEEQKLFDDDEGGEDDGDYRGMYGEHRLFDGDNYGIEQAPYAPFPPHGGGNSKMPAKGMPISAAAGDGTDMGAGRQDSLNLKRFVDIMLQEEDDEEQGGRQAGENDGVAAPQPDRASDNMTFDAALMEEAMNSFLPDDALETGQGLFEMPSNSVRPGAPPPTNGSSLWSADRAQVKSSGPRPIAATSSGVTAVHTIEPGDDVHVVQGGGDVEEGNLPVGVAVVAATAEPVTVMHTDGSPMGNNGNNNNEASLQLERDRRRDRKRMMYILAFVGVALSVVATWPAIVLTKGKKKKPGHGHGHRSSSSSRDGMGRPPCRPGFRRDKHGMCNLPNVPCKPGFGRDNNGNCQPLAQDESFSGHNRGDSDDDDYHGGQVHEAGVVLEQGPGWGAEQGDGGDRAETLEDVAGGNENGPRNAFEGVSRGRLPSLFRARGERIGSIPDDVHDGSLSSFTVTLAGTEFFCGSDL